MTAKDSVLDAAAEKLAPTFGASTEQVRTALDQAIDAGQLSVTISIGLYVVIAGGVVVLVGGILGLRGSGESAVAGQADAPAPPMTEMGVPDAPPAPMPPPASPPDPGVWGRCRGRADASRGRWPLAGGVLAVVGSFLPWAEISAGPFTEQAKGIDGWEGKAAIIAGAVMVAGGSGSSPGRTRRWLGFDPAPPSAVWSQPASAIYTARHDPDQLVDAAATELPRVEVERALDNGLLQLTIAIGLYLVIAGGIQGIVAALVALRRPGRDGRAVRAGLRGWSSTGTEPPGVLPILPRCRTSPRRPARSPTTGEPPVSSQEHRLDTGDRRVVDVTDLVEAFCASDGRDGLVNVFVPHATAGVALMETGSGSEGDLEDLLERLLPRDDRYRHRHGSLGHGATTSLPVIVAPSPRSRWTPAPARRSARGSVVVVDPNRENEQRRLRLTFVPA